MSEPRRRETWAFRGGDVSGLEKMDIKLVMFREDGSRRVFPLTPGATTIGRKDDCTIRIPLAVVSRRHAEIFVDEDGVVLRDLGAANGTYLNNRRVQEEDVEPGDHIMRLDADDDGVVTFEEFAKPLQEVFARIDTNGDGEIDQQEAAAAPPPPPHRRRGPVDAQGS